MATALQTVSMAFLSNALVSEDHPLYEYLTDTAVLNEGFSARDPLFELSPLDHAGSVFVCRDLHSTARIVCKFFSARTDLPAGEPLHLMDYEFHTLSRVRSAGFQNPPYRAVRPLGKRESLGCLLAEEYVSGRDLDHFIALAAHYGGVEELMGRLDLLADFFAILHRSTSRGHSHNFCRTCRDFRTLVDSLSRVDGVPGNALSELRHLCDKWENRSDMWIETSSLVHGDATPTNFIFDSPGGVTAIDFERSHVGDPTHDLGLLAAELKHHFALRIHQAAAAEPFISHFLKRYGFHAGLSSATFERLTFRSRFHMAMGELRIARNPWLPHGHRRWLAWEACRCLRL
jgi:aminoglycoside phosphotransferase (APT) family kinase protein